MSMSSATTGFSTPGLFSVGGVFERSVGLLSRHVPLFVGVMVVAGLPSLLVNFALLDHRPPETTLRLAGIAGIAALVLMTVSQTVIYHAAFQDMVGKPVRLSGSVGLAMRRLLPVVGTVICMGLAIMFGFILLIVPGIIFAAALGISVPVCVVEQVGPIRSLRRSAALTKGHRWKIIGIGLLLFVISIAVSILEYLCRFGLGPAIGEVGAFLIQSVLGAFMSLVAVVMYHDLRVAKEGVDTYRIAAVFD